MKLENLILNMENFMSKHTGTSQIRMDFRIGEKYYKFYRDASGKMLILPTNPINDDLVDLKIEDISEDMEILNLNICYRGLSFKEHEAEN